MSGTLEVRAMHGAARAKAVEDVVMGTPRGGKTRASEIVDAVSNAWHGHTIEILRLGIERHPVLRVGKLLHQGSDPNMPRGQANEFGIQRLAGHAEVGKVGCGGDWCAGRP